MKHTASQNFCALILLLPLISPIFQELRADLPATGHNKVAYYAFDATPVNQGKLRLTEFTDNANIIVLFEGTIFELCDSIHYGSSSSYILTINGGPYKYYRQILDDIKALRATGIKVLMNVDDTKLWSTDTPFTTYDGRPLNYQEYAVFIDSCVTAVGLDGISLDIEHGATDNLFYRNFVKELGKYFGPLSKHNTTRIYTAAIYYSTWGIPGPTIFGWDRTIAAHLNFVMDMGYFQNNNTRFQRWADSLGNSKVMQGFSHHEPNNSLSIATAWAAWHPKPDKAGIMVFAGNVNKSYTDSIFATMDASLTDVNENNIHTKNIPQDFELLQNYPNPFNPATTLQFHIPQNGFVTLKVYDILGNEVITLIEKHMHPGRYTAIFNSSKNASGVYFARITVLSKETMPYFKIIKMSMIK